jgi:hypothetical protein
MKNKFLLIVLILLNTLQSCNSQNSNYNDVLDRFNGEDFTCLKGVFVNIRGNIKNDTVVLMMSKYRFKYSPYIIRASYSNKEVLEIDSKLANRDSNNYFSEDEIKTFTKCFLKYKLEVLAVDNDGNVYINPYQQETPILLRKSIYSIPIDFNQYKLYKGNWYIKK